MEGDQLLNVSVTFLGTFKGWQTFYTKMRKDGRISIPNLVLRLLEDKQTNLTGYALEVRLDPV
ncbi:MAG: hypothetical protein ABSE15_01950 [Candidatus Bathyarchaeia archaeon]